MDTQVTNENSKSLEPCGQANGDVVFELEDSGTPPTSACSEGKTKGSDLCPVTPILNRENGDSVFVANSPLSLELPPNDGGCLESSPRTPDEGVFDPFAPGPDEMLLAPICMKLVKRSQKIVARRLSFEDIEAYKGDRNNNVDSVSEKMLLETFYGTLLEAIILKQSEEFYAESQTPTSPKPLTGIADTCPRAPIKHASSKPRVIDPALCRKLEF